MWMVLIFLTFGIFPAVWLSGYVVFERLNRGMRLPFTALTAWSVAPAISLPVWSLAMALSARWGMFHAPAWGALGWIVCALLVPSAWRNRRLGHRQAIGKRLILAALVAGSFALYSAFPHDSFFVGRDQATYANQALHIARFGDLLLDLPIGISDPNLAAAIADSSYIATGIYADGERLVVQFSPILPIWLAIAFSALGIVGLQGFNAVVAALSVPVFFGLGSRLMSRRVALAATALFALNPIQIWISRITLSEILAQYFLLSGLLLASLASRGGRVGNWVLAGLALGATVFVRIDGFVLAPLGVAFAWIARSLNRADLAREERARSLGVIALLALLSIGIPFYFLTSRPYIAAQAKNLLPLAAATAVLLILWMTRWGAGLLTLLVRRSAFWIGLAVTLALLGIFAYFIRPHWQPFATYNNPNAVLFGSRDFREDSFVNLGIYVTPVVAFLGLVGFWHQLRRAFAGSAGGARLLLLIVVGGYSALYLHNPSISPDHPWGMRRFVPVIIPGFVLLALSTLDHARSWRWLRRLHLPLTVLVTAAALAYPNFRMRAGLLLREYAGAYALVSSIADAVPENAVLLCDVSPRLFGHLVLGRGLRTFRINFRSPEGFDAAQAVLGTAVPKEQPYYVLTDNPKQLKGEKAIREFERELTWLEQTTAPPANRIRRASFDFYLYQRNGPLEEPWRYLADLGFAPINGVREGGFWPIERDGDARTRWTQGEAWLDIPIEKGWSPHSVGLDIVAIPPNGTWLTVRANGSEIYNAKIDKAPLSLQLSLPPKLRKRFKLEFVSDTFRPSELGASSDSRELGIRLKSLTVR